MPTQYDSFARTALGRSIAAVLDTPDRLTEMRAFTREGHTAIAAVVSVLAPLLEPLRTASPKEFNLAKQFAGHRVGVSMRAAGYTIRRTGVRVPGKLFTVAATWESTPPGAPPGQEVAATAA